MVAGVEMPVESDRPEPAGGAPALAGAPARAADDQPRRRHAGAAGIAQGARAARLSGACPARRRAQPAVRAAVGRAQRSARRAALVPQQDQGPRRRARPADGSTPAATPSGSTSRTASSMRSRSPARRRRASRRSRRSGCERWPRCSTATFSRAWRSTAARPSTAGSSRSGAGSAAATPRCWSISSASVSGRRGVRISGEVARARAVRPARPRDPADALARRGRIREGEEHLAATARLFEAEGLDCAPIRDAWRSARAQGDSPPRRRRRAASADAGSRAAAPTSSPSRLAAPRSR